MNCDFRIISEWDTTMMFMAALSSDPDFLQLFLSKTPDVNAFYTIETVYRSKLESGLGETDLQVIYKTANETHAILIENKIDASETTRQYERYVLRAQKGQERNEYSKFFVFLLSPQKYRETNKEAQKYDYFLSYEECLEYFGNREDLFSNYCRQGLALSVGTVKHKNDTNVNVVAVDSLRKYEQYVKAHYPKLDFKNNTKSGKVNGWWVKMGVSLSGASIHHKTGDGVVDLSIANGAEKFNRFVSVEKWLHDSGHNDVMVVKTQKSATFRINVPVIHMWEPFEGWNYENLNKCLDAAMELTELADMFAVVKEAFQ